MSIELTETLLSKAAGWEAMKRARAYISLEQVLSSYWAPPLLRGVVQVNGMSFRASMVIHNDIDIENLCTCRDARETGQICAHSVAVGLHWLASQKPAEPAKAKPSAAPAKAAAAQGPVARGLQVSPDGEQAELGFILPPSLDRATEAGKIMLVVEARSGGRTTPLAALSRTKAYAFSQADERLLRKIEEVAGGQLPAMLQLSAAAFEEFLPLLAEHPRISMGRATPVTVSKSPINLAVRATLEPNGEITVAAKSGSPPMQLLQNWAFADATFRPIGLSGVFRDVLKKPLRIERKQVPGFLGTEWPQLERNAEANFRIDDFSFEPQPPRFILELGGGLAQLSALLQCAYGPRIMTPGVTSSSEDVWLPDPQKPTRYSTRDIAAEREALVQLQRAGFSGPDQSGRLQLNGQNAVLNFFGREFPRLQKVWSVTMQERLQRSTRENTERIEPSFTITPSGVQWFDLGAVFTSSSGRKFSPSEIQNLLRSGQAHVRLPNGKAAVFDPEGLQEIEETLRDCAPQQHPGGYRISNAQAGFVQESLRDLGSVRVEAPEQWRQKIFGQSGSIRPEALPCSMGDLDSVLRPYQKSGVAWLWFLRENGFGGILADEMGLGKTLQALAFFKTVRQQNPKGLPLMVVCPTSLVYNWVAEAARFTPGLKVLPVQGPDRHALFSKINESDIVITSYALLRRDAEKYRDLQFDTVVLDEAQHIKNRQTQNAQAVKSVRSEHRIVLTGTPMENSVLDLWSIFDFLMPGYLGTAADFRERYELPIAKGGDAAAQKRLGRRLKPFLLRRTKGEVAPELPEKIQQVAWCEMTADQKTVYEQLIEATRKEVLEAVGEQGLAKSRMLVLSAILRLRQVCCDLRLLKLESVDPANASGKLDLFAELMEEVLDGGHRVLVFSQFTSMLAILKEHLDSEGVRYCYLDGSTPDRGAVVSRYQNDAEIPVFLISLKAGGVGLNLAQADTVIHFDPWWNPAVEDQATDRAHRIGQKRVVTSYKLITRNSIEEKILTLQNKKRELIDATIAGEEQFASALSWDEIQELLR